MFDDLREPIQICKLDAARQQLKTATRLWFYDTDPVSAHSLASAAHEVIHVVSKAINPNRPDLFFDSVHIPEEFRTGINSIFRRPANFFKHADRDPNGILVFSRGMTWTFIYYSIYGLQLLDIELSDEFLIFQHWTAIHFPGQLTEDARRYYGDCLAVEHLTELQTLTKRDFLDSLMESFARRRAG